MYTMSIVAQQGLYFAAQLFKDGKIIGGIGNDKDGVYINLSQKLTVSETRELLNFTSNLNSYFKERDLRINYRIE